MTPSNLATRNYLYITKENLDLSGLGENKMK